LLAWLLPVEENGNEGLFLRVLLTLAFLERVDGRGIFCKIYLLDLTDGGANGYMSRPAQLFLVPLSLDVYIVRRLLVGVGHY
jgi:hypothetical protein